MAEERSVIVLNWNQAAVNPLLELSVNYFFYGLESIEQVCPDCCTASATALALTLNPNPNPNRLTLTSDVNISHSKPKRRRPS